MEVVTAEIKIAQVGYPCVSTSLLPNGSRDTQAMRKVPPADPYPFQLLYFLMEVVTCSDKNARRKNIWVSTSLLPNGSRDIQKTLSSGQNDKKYVSTSLLPNGSHDEADIHDKCQKRFIRFNFFTS